MAPSPDAMRALLSEGLASYLDALVAMREFQQDVHARCQAMLKARLGELSQVLGCRAAPHAVTAYIYPPNPLRASLSDGIWLGAQWPIPGVDLTYLVGLGWWQEEDMQTVCEAFMSVEATSQDLFGQVSQIFALQSGCEISSEYYGIDIWARVSPEDPDACLATLDTLVHRWVDLWSRVGGLRAIRPVQSRKSS